MAKAKPKTDSPKAPRKPRVKKVGKEVGIPTTQSEEIPTLDGTVLDSMTEGKGFEALGNPVHPPIAPTGERKGHEVTDDTAGNYFYNTDTGQPEPISSASQEKKKPTNPDNQPDANASHNVIDASQPTPQPTTQDSNQNRGNVSSTGAAAVSLETPGQPDILAFSREGETRAACWERLRKQARLAGMPRGQGPGTAYEWATRETERLFPPKAPDPEPVVEVEVEPAEQMVDKPESVPETPAPIPVQPAPAQVEQGVGGLGDLPPGWPELPANAPLQVEIAWVSANRLRVRSGTGVDLSRALNPAPSYSALSWLETSILFPSKFADISVKATASQDDEKEHIRREKLAIEEIRSLLSEMLEG